MQYISCPLYYLSSLCRLYGIIRILTYSCPSEILLSNTADAKSASTPVRSQIPTANRRQGPGAAETEVAQLWLEDE